MDNYDKYGHDEQPANNFGTFAAGIALGAMIGSVVTLLTAPQSGEQTRRELEQELGRASNRLHQDAQGSLDDGRHRMEDTIRSLEREIKSLRDRVDQR